MDLELLLAWLRSEREVLGTEYTLLFKSDSRTADELRDKRGDMMIITAMINSLERRIAHEHATAMKGQAA